MFLETVTYRGDAVLIPINRIRHIVARYDSAHSEGYYVIKIVTDSGEFEECFGEDLEIYSKRFEQIKSMINCPNI
jgi:hypothetical protein